MVKFVEPHFRCVYPEEAISERVDDFQKMKYSLHFHCLTPDSFKECLSHVACQFEDRFAILEMKENNDEFISIIQKNNRRLRS